MVILKFNFGPLSNMIVKKSHIWTSPEPEKVTFGELFSARFRPDPKVDFYMLFA